MLSRVLVVQEQCSLFTNYLPSFFKPFCCFLVNFTKAKWKGASIESNLLPRLPMIKNYFYKFPGNRIKSFSRWKNEVISVPNCYLKLIMHLKWAPVYRFMILAWSKNDWKPIWIKLLAIFYLRFYWSSKTLINSFKLSIHDGRLWTLFRQLKPPAIIDLLISRQYYASSSHAWNFQSTRLASAR